MGLFDAGISSLRGSLADQWVEYFTAPTFDELLLVSPGVRRANHNAHFSPAAITNGSKIEVPENTAAIITDGGRVVSLTTQPGYFIFKNDGLPSVFSKDSPFKSLIQQSWERLKFSGHVSQSQSLYYVNLKEVRNLHFATPGPIPFRDFSLAAPNGSQAPVLRLSVRGQFSIRIVDPLRFFQNFLPANTSWYSLSENAASSQLKREFVSALRTAIQAMSSRYDIASISAHNNELASEVTHHQGPAGSWIDRFGIEVHSLAITSIEYDPESKALMDKYNLGTMLRGETGSAYAQATIADAALAMAESGEGGAGMIGLAMGVNATRALLPQGLDTTDSASTTPPDHLAALQQLKVMLEQGLITPEQFSTKQQEILGRL